MSRYRHTSGPIIESELHRDRRVAQSRTARPPFIKPMAAALIVVSEGTFLRSVRSNLHEHGLPCCHEDAGETEDRERAEVALRRSISCVKSNLISRFHVLSAFVSSRAGPCRPGHVRYHGGLKYPLWQHLKPQRHHLRSPEAVEARSRRLSSFSIRPR